MKAAPLPTAILRDPRHWPALGFGLGAAPVAPGTFGTLLGIPLYLLLVGLPLTVYLAVVALLFLVGIAACRVTARALGVHDHPAIVFDEVVGYLVTMTLAPSGMWAIATGFALFRLFDIWKPWPIRWIDRRVHGGLGIMLDDLLAGVFALLVLQLIAWMAR
ncbi:MAG: phosphatidylglycerophosphatase A [Gammaproteobacteria bacterium]|nr:phosphatidylglycerophosphatase A [Gammaproteobacteria bacterium]